MTAIRSALQQTRGECDGGGLWEQQLVLLREYPELVPRLRAAIGATEVAVADGFAHPAGRVPADPSVPTVAAVALRALREATTYWLSSPAGVTPAGLLDEIVKLLHTGLTETFHTGHF